MFAIKTNYTKTKRRKIKNADFIAEKILPKKARGKKTKLLSKLETNDLHISYINSKVNINKWCENFVYFITIFIEDNMSGESIQVPFGVIRDKTKKKLIKVNLTQNFWKDVLFDHLSCLGHLENPAIKDAIIDGIVDNIAFQKYLLATGLLKDTIQDTLDMIVTDGKCNNASLRRVFDTKYPLVMKKVNPVDFVFKDKAKFDAQTPIIGTLLTEIELGKSKNEKAIENQLKGAPPIKDLQIAEWLE